MIPGLHHWASLQGRAAEDGVQKLLTGIGALLPWQKAPKPSNQIRNAMMKLGPEWGVKRFSQGKDRPPAAVAKELEDRMLQIGAELLGYK